MLQAASDQVRRAQPQNSVSTAGWLEAPSQDVRDARRPAEASAGYQLIPSSRHTHVPSTHQPATENNIPTMDGVTLLAGMPPLSGSTLTQPTFLSLHSDSGGLQDSSFGASETPRECDIMAWASSMNFSVVSPNTQALDSVEAWGDEDIDMVFR